MIPQVRCQKGCVTIGELPTSFIESLSYYETVSCLVKKMNELVKAFNDVVEVKINEYIDQRFNDMMIDAMYDEATETLVLSLTDGSN